MFFLKSLYPTVLLAITFSICDKATAHVITLYEGKSCTDDPKYDAMLVVQKLNSDGTLGLPLPSTSTDTSSPIAEIVTTYTVPDGTIVVSRFTENCTSTSCPEPGASLELGESESNIVLFGSPNPNTAGILLKYDSVTASNGGCSMTQEIKPDGEYNSDKEPLACVYPNASVDISYNCQSSTG